MSNWIADAEAALSSRKRNPQSSTDIDIVDTHAPALIDAGSARALLTPFFAAFMWAAVVFRETQSHSSLDPFALLLRVLALAMTLRALGVLWSFAQRLRLVLQWRRYGLVVTDEGLLFRAPDRDVVVQREDVLDVREQNAIATSARSGGRSANVYVVTHPSTGRTHVSLPPVFAASPRALAERLMRWRGQTDETKALPTTTSEPLPSKLWDRSAAGEVLEGVVVIRHGNTWMKRGPYASMLLGVAVLDGFIRLPTQAQRSINPVPALLLAAALVIVPGAWYLFTRATLRARNGLALVLSPQDVLSRGRGGVLRAGWSSVSRVEVYARSSWSLLQGGYTSRTLIVHRQREASVQCAETFMDTPIEVVAALCDAYRKQAPKNEA
ncbi:MAG TPA: hypothetical protein VFN67_20780 [Polyangiales bacterium]|nr:hypothetical protein [Polyangiales bacterium]